MPISLEETEDTKTNWCCIVSTFLVSGGLCFFGVSLALRGDGRTGLVLLLSSGGLLILSICAAIGKFKPHLNGKSTPSVAEDPDDRPPSYRLSWRRSFMKRATHRSEDEGEGGGRRGRRWWQRRRRDRDEEEGNDDEGGGGGIGGGSRRPSHHPNMTPSSSCESLLAGLCGVGARGGAGDERCTQSLSNLLDPPSYQDAVALLDDAAIRKLRSEMCLPSAMLERA